MRRFAQVGPLCLALALALVGCDDNDDDNDLSRFSASLSGANEVPSRTTSATGTVDVDVDGSIVSYRLELHGIGSVTAAHVHSGAAGVNGPVRVELYRGPTTGLVDGILVQATFTASDVTGIGFNDLLNEMRNGNAYVNVHTTTFPDGEIRGQVRAVD